MAVAVEENVESAVQRDLTEAESQYVDDLLDRAERLLTARIGDLQERVEGDPEFSALVSDIEAEAVARVYRAPEGGVVRQEAEGNYSYSLNMQVASGLLDILDREWALLGVSTWGSLAPETDGYLASRYGGVPSHWQFQYGWPAQDQLSDWFV